MVGRVALFDGDKEATAGGAHFPFSLKREAYRDPVLKHLSALADDGKRGAKWGRATKLNIVLCGNRAGWFAQALRVHERNGCRPVSMTIEQGTDNATVHHPGEGLVVVFWRVFHTQATVNAVGIDAQAFFVRWPTAKTNRRGGIHALNAFFHTLRWGDRLMILPSSLLRSVDVGRPRGKNMAGKRKKTVRKVRVAHELPKRRRMAIEEAMEAHKTEDRPEWDRVSHWGDIRFNRKRIKPGTLRTVHLPLLNVSLGDEWPIPVTIIHGARPGPCITVIGGIHGDELTGPSACTHLLSNAFTDEGKPLDPTSLAGTLRIVPVVNLPGYRMKSRYFPDGRDLNRQFPGNPGGSTTRRVANQVWTHLVEGSDAIIDLHSAAKGRRNMPQVRVDMTHTSSFLLAKSFGIEILLDSIPPKGTLRRTANRADIPVITYEGGSADTLGDQSVKVAVHGVMNVLRSMRMVPGNPQRPRFRIMASGSTWLRAGEGGLLDMFVRAGSIMREGEVVATISDPATPGMTVDIVAPEDGLIIGAATNPFTAAGMPVGHFLPISKHFRLLEEQIDEKGHFIVNGSLEERVWREEHEVSEVSLDGEWSGGTVDSEWVSSKSQSEEKDFEEEAA